MHTLLKNKKIQQKISDPRAEGYIIIDATGSVIDLKATSTSIFTDRSLNGKAVGTPIYSAVKEEFHPCFKGDLRVNSLWVEVSGETYLVEALEDSGNLVYVFYKGKSDPKAPGPQLLNELLTDFLWEDDLNKAWNRLFDRLQENLGLDCSMYVEVTDSGVRLAAGVDFSTNREDWFDIVKGVVETRRRIVLESYLDSTVDGSFGVKVLAGFPIRTNATITSVVLLGSSYEEQFSAEMLDFIEELCLHVSKMTDRVAQVDRLTDINREFTERNSRLILEQKSMSNILNGALDGIMLTDGHFHLSDLNHAGKELLGVHNQEIHRMTLFDLVIEEERPLVEYYAKELVENGSVYGEVRIHSHHKDSRTISFNAVKSINPNQNLIMFRDISRQKLVEQQLVEAKQEADLASRAKTDFLLRMSHEFRTPLNTIIGFSELLQEYEWRDRQKSRRIEKIGEAGKEVLTKINGILAETKEQYQSHDPSTPDTFSLSPVMNKIFYVINPKALERSIQFSVSFIDFEGILVRGTETQVYQPLIEVLDKLITSVVEGGFIQVQASQRDQEVCLEIFYSGRVFTLEESEWLNRPSKGDSDPPFAHVDTGIIIATRMIDELEGSVSLNTDERRGEVVTITLPII